MCKVQSDPVRSKLWTQAGQAEPRCSSSHKISIIVGSLFAAVGTACVVVGLYDVYTGDTMKLKEGLIFLGGGAASAIISTIAWTCFCCTY